MRIHLVEISPALRALQQTTLRGHDVTWHDSIGQALASADGPTIVVGNEFLDALPIHQLTRTERGWHERMVDVDDHGDRLVPIVAPPASPLEALVPARLRQSPPGSVVEICPAALDIMGELGAHLTQQGGAALFIDYGHIRSGVGETLQAMAGHSYADPFDAPGEADLTAHVDFEQLARTAAEAGLRIHGPTSQGAFLEALGIRQRAERLVAGSPARRGEITAALDRLVASQEMGTLFKVVAFSASAWPAPAGFDTP